MSIKKEHQPVIEEALVCGGQTYYRNHSIVPVRDNRILYMPCPTSTTCANQIYKVPV